MICIRLLCIIWTISCFSIKLNSWQVSSVSNEDEDKFFNTYGNNVHKAGVWKALRQTRKDEAEYMMDVCKQAHERAGLGLEDISASGFDTRILKYSNGKYESIMLDIVKYGVGVGITPELDSLRYWYITKGLRKDCVYYLEPIDDRAKELRLTSRHVCGIEM